MREGFFRVWRGRRKEDAGGWRNVQRRRASALQKHSGTKLVSRFAAQYLVKYRCFCKGSFWTFRHPPAVHHYPPRHEEKATSLFPVQSGSPELSIFRLKR